MENIKKLDVFDFDGTIFLSPENTPENHAKYEKLTGIPWLLDKHIAKNLSKKFNKFIPPRKGWWGRPETLQAPLVPQPAPKEWFIEPVVQALKESKNDQNTLSLIVTGRHLGLKQHVYRILHEGNIAEFDVSLGAYTLIDQNINCHLLGDDGVRSNQGKPSETFPWKEWLLEGYLQRIPSIQTLEVWEDRDEHVEKFLELNKKFDIEVIVNHINSKEKKIERQIKSN